MKENEIWNPVLMRVESKHKSVFTLTPKTSSLIDEYNRMASIHKYIQREIANILGCSVQYISFLKKRYDAKVEIISTKKPIVYFHPHCTQCNCQFKTKYKRRLNLCSKQCRIDYQLFVRSRCWRCKNKLERPSVSRVCRKCGTERRREWVKSEHSKRLLAETQKRQNAKFPEKLRARTALNHAIKNGKIIKPSACSYCGIHKRLDGHHVDYSKPLKVKWLCRVCHIGLHMKLKNK